MLCQIQTVKVELYDKYLSAQGACWISWHGCTMQQWALPVLCTGSRCELMVQPAADVIVSLYHHHLGTAATV